MATTRREGTIPAAGGKEKRGRVVWVPSSTYHMINKTPSSSLHSTTTQRMINKTPSASLHSTTTHRMINKTPSASLHSTTAHRMINKTPSSSLHSTTTHHIKKTPTKSSSRSATQRSAITTSDKPSPDTLMLPTRTSRLDPSRKETRDKTSTSRSNAHGSSSALQKPSLNERRRFDKPPPSARLPKHSIQGGVNGSKTTPSNKLTVRNSSSFTSKIGPVSASSSRLSARPAPVDRRKNVPPAPSSVLKPRTRSGGVSKSGSTHLSSASKKDAAAGASATMNWRKKKNGPKNGTSGSEIEVERQNDHKDELGDGGAHHLVTEVNDDEGSADNNNSNNVDHDHDEQVGLPPDMSEMPCVNEEHLGDPNLTDLHEEEIIKNSDHHGHHTNVGDDDDNDLLHPTSQDEDELVGNGHKPRDPEESTAINISDADNEGQNPVEKTVEPADHDQHVEAMAVQGEEDQKNNIEAEAAAGQETENTTNSSNNKREGELGSAGGGSSIVKNKKEGQVYNDVIEETSKKLMDQNRKNKVKALAGAFETVISLQDTNSKASN